ncbi:hypothetical protein [Chitinibacter sp. ZOR0017]|uniref:hypothetical protein n=1 Tax=Chitinibacter sp. ZOR0017 TaxID=1339254 RepID=UPI0012E03799|nr:hypothetical protein [Chitinibacter sp. ZOR0017]
MSYPQLIWLALNGIALGIALSEHGKPKTGKHSFWSTLIAVGLGYWIVSAGGFFSGGH